MNQQEKEYLTALENAKKDTRVLVREHTGFFVVLRPEEGGYRVYVRSPNGIVLHCSVKPTPCCGMYVLCGFGALRALTADELRTCMLELAACMVSAVQIVFVDYRNGDGVMYQHFRDLCLSLGATENTPYKNRNTNNILYPLVLVCAPYLVGEDHPYDNDDADYDNE